MSTKLDKEAWRGRLIDERQAYLAQQLVVMHPDLKVVHDKIKELRSYCIVENKGKGLLVTANSGMGKTRLAKWFLDKYPPEHPVSGSSNVPVIFFSSPSDPSRKQLGIALLRAIGDPIPKRGDAQEMFERAIHLIRAINTRTIFIDNIHDVPDRRGTSVVMGIGNWIRDLIEQSRSLVVLLGTPAAKEIISVNSQVLRRVETRSIRMFEVRTTGGRKLFHMLMGKLDQMLPMAELSGLGEPTLADAICHATYGILDYIIALMIGAMFAARERNSECISREDLANAFEGRHGYESYKFNPFIDGGPKRSLDQFGEPFYCFFDSANPFEFTPKPKAERKINDKNA
ncbi:TniB family NTP-binding protein [Herbaspirillum sp.]|uniref:TniB family NTP-binding protein n=1 Tax=Herbaspirillum sp. TaxID=1890675 RepID=UPI0031DF9C56